MRGQRGDQGDGAARSGGDVALVDQVARQRHVVQRYTCVLRRPGEGGVIKNIIGAAVTPGAQVVVEVGCGCGMDRGSGSRDGQRQQRAAQVGNVQGSILTGQKLTWEDLRVSVCFRHPCQLVSEVLIQARSNLHDACRAIHHKNNQ